MSRAKEGFETWLSELRKQKLMKVQNVSVPLIEKIIVNSSRFSHIRIFIMSSIVVNFSKLCL